MWRNGEHSGNPCACRDQHGMFKGSTCKRRRATLIIIHEQNELLGSAFHSMAASNSLSAGTSNSSYRMIFFLIFLHSLNTAVTIVSTRLCATLRMPHIKTKQKHFWEIWNLWASPWEMPKSFLCCCLRQSKWFHRQPHIKISPPNKMSPSQDH